MGTYTAQPAAEPPTAAANADAVWDEAKAGHVGAGSFGEEVQLHSLSTEISALNDFDPVNDTVANVTLVATTTTNSDMRGTDNAATAANWTAARAGYVDNLNISENVAGTSEISALNDLSAAQVNAEMVDVIATDTYAEPGQEAPAATNTLATKIGYLFKAFRNRIVQNATTLEIYNDAGDTVDQKATVSDDGTDYTRGEIGTGP